MRISFDVDDTLVCSAPTPTEQYMPWWWRWRYPELLRRGTRSLMHELVRRRCELWIYTTSYRGEGYLRGWFARLGVRLGGVVNQQRHEKVVGRHGPSKYPPAFDIDLHVDDLPGVGIEGERHGFRVVVVSPDDADWTARILGAL
jgi:hypothetical protein